MKTLSIVPLTLALVACGGGSTSETDSNDSTPNSSPDSNSKQAIDCSPNKDSRFAFPIPEYPGAVAAYTHTEGGGFDPENFYEIARVGIIFAVSGSKEGLLHTGPTWTKKDEYLTTTLNYTLAGSNETWSIIKDGIASDGTQYNDHVHLEIEQPETCGLSYRIYDENGDIESEFTSSAYEWVSKSYEDGDITGRTETEIYPDRSGKTTSISFTSLSDYPVTIIEWDSTGEDVLIKTCKTTAGTNCQTAVAP